MASNKQNVQFPPLRISNPKIADPGKVRLGDSCITAQYPLLRVPDQKIADPGKVRLGDSCITAQFPPRK
jgi:hypothetical protein